MYAQKFKVVVVIRGESRACPLDWLDQFCMRNFTNSADFDDTLPVADGQVEASFRLTPERFAEGLGAWALPQRGKGEGPALCGCACSARNSLRCRLDLALRRAGLLFLGGGVALGAADGCADFR